MSKTSPTLDNSRLEIVILAAAVFILVSLLATLILVCVCLKHSQLPAENLTDVHYGTAWGGSWSERWDAGPLRLYRDDEDFLDQVRRRSRSIAEEVRRELTGFEQLVPLRISDEESATDLTVADAAAMVMGTVREAGSQASEDNTSPDESNHSASESSASSTAREQTLGTATRRLERADHDEDCDSDAQDLGSSES
ncbi:hypothetical protein E4U41_002304 [Claviceps citrina]|nr:hypothetical protein E4U41_002304 [Claviceps citrina]